MIALDYFLYDNRTWSPQCGHAWGIKAATGALTARQDLKGDFLRYCAALPSEHGLLAGFGEAMGGIRSRTGRGYLLCLTLETKDPFCKSSWAVFGLWCPDTTTLENVLRAGSFSAAKAALGDPTPPEAIRVSAGSVAFQQSKKGVGQKTVNRFVSGAAVREVTSILSSALRAKTPLPNILGISATCHLPVLAEGAFDRVYCHPMDEPAEQVLVRHLLSPNELESESEPSNSLGPTKRRSTMQQHRGSSALVWAMALTAVGLTATAIVVVISARSEKSPGTTIRKETAVSSSTPWPAASPPAETASATNEASKAIAQRLEEFKNLDPAALRQSQGYQIAEKVAVLPANEDRRQRLLQAYATLLAVREQVVNGASKGSVTSFDTESKPHDSFSGLQTVAHGHTEAFLGVEACATIKEAFGFEVERKDSIVSRWCTSVDQMAKR